jgi:hypothetical protein
MIQEKWDLLKNDHAYSLDHWHGCLSFLRRYLRGWNLQLLGDQKKDKIALVNRIQELDTFAETRLLSIHDWEERIDIENKLDFINRAKELHCKQKAGNKWLLEGDFNSLFFINLTMAGGGKIPFLF